MSFNEDRWIRNPDTGQVDHINKPPIDKLIEEIKAKGQGLYPHVPIKRDEDGNLMTELRANLMSSPTIKFRDVVDGISEQFNRLVQLLSNLKF